jgi:hypothetical protein
MSRNTVNVLVIYYRYEILENINLFLTPLIFDCYLDRGTLLAAGPTWIIITLTDRPFLVNPVVVARFAST